MGLLRRVVTLPLAPLEGLLWLAEVLAKVAEEELADPDRWRSILQEAEAAHECGELTDEELEAVEDEVLEHLSELGALRVPPPSGRKVGG